MIEVSGVLTADTTNLKKFIMEHPDYPIAVLCGEDASCCDYGWTYASYIGFGLGEILDCEQDIDDCRVFSDRDIFKEELEEKLWEELKPIAEEEFQKLLAKEIEKYEPCWKDCIIIYVDN